MNKVEALKTERDGLAVKDMIAHYAKTGWESIPEDDVQRLKWYGLFLRNPTPGFFMIRVRIPGGKTGSYQLKALADIAGTYGNESWTLRRGNKYSSGRSRSKTCQRSLPRWRRWG